MATKLDLKKKLKNFYRPSTEPEIITLPKYKYLAIDGKGDPNTAEEYKSAIETLFPVAYKMKFICKKELEKDFVVMSLEGLWWTKIMEEFSIDDKSNWLWTSLIMQPDFITDEIFERAVNEVKEKKDLSSIDKIRLITVEEGKAVQLMHIGPYSAEGPNIQKIHAFIKEQGGKFDGLTQKHHEIYLSDFRRVAPEKLKTIIRQPFV